MGTHTHARPAFHARSVENDFENGSRALLAEIDSRRDGESPKKRGKIETVMREPHSYTLPGSALHGRV
ncbi:MAG: hypothetical protein M3H12_14960 [Chromatiales bacterium]